MLPADSPVQQYLGAYNNVQDALTAANAAGLYLPTEMAAQLANAGVGLYGAPGTWYGAGPAQAAATTGLGGFMSTVVGPAGLFMGVMNILGNMGGMSYAGEFGKSLEVALKSDDPFKYILDWKAPADSPLAGRFGPEELRNDTTPTWRPENYKGSMLSALINQLPDQALSYIRQDANLPGVTKELIKGLGVIPSRDKDFRGMRDTVDARAALTRIYPNIDTEALDRLYAAKRGLQEMDWNNALQSADSQSMWYAGLEDRLTKQRTAFQQDIREYTKRLYESIGIEYTTTTTRRTRNT